MIAHDNTYHKRNRNSNYMKELACVVENGNDSWAAYHWLTIFPEHADKMFNCIYTNYLKGGDNLEVIGLLIYGSLLSDKSILELKKAILSNGDYEALWGVVLDNEIFSNEQKNNFWNMFYHDLSDVEKLGVVL